MNNLESNRILVYGDSTTWGQKAYSDKYPDSQQWPNILNKKLGENWQVIQAGLCARIAGNYEVDKPVLNGQDVFNAILLSALPLLVVVVALGTNDLKNKYDRSAREIVDDLFWYKKTIVENEDSEMTNPPTIIYIAPPNFVNNKKYFDASETKRLEVNRLLKEQAEHVVELNNLEMSADGVHFAPSAHQLVADKVYKKLMVVVRGAAK